LYAATIAVNTHTNTPRPNPGSISVSGLGWKGYAILESELQSTDPEAFLCY